VIKFTKVLIFNRYQELIFHSCNVHCWSRANISLVELMSTVIAWCPLWMMNKLYTECHQICWCIIIVVTSQVWTYIVWHCYQLVWKFVVVFVSTALQERTLYRRSISAQSNTVYQPKATAWTNTLAVGAGAKFRIKIVSFVIVKKM